MYICYINNYSTLKIQKRDMKTLFTFFLAIICSLSVFSQIEVTDEIGADVNFLKDKYKNLDLSSSGTKVSSTLTFSTDDIFAIYTLENDICKKIEICCNSKKYYEKFNKATKDLIIKKGDRFVSKAKNKKGKMYEITFDTKENVELLKEYEHVITLMEKLK